MSNSRSPKYSLSATARWFVSAGVGASLASTVHWCIDIVADYTGPAREIINDVSYGVTGIIFAITTGIAKKRMDKSSILAAQLDQEVKSALDEHELLRERVARINEKIIFDKTTIKSIAIAKDSISDAKISPYINPVLKKIDEEKLQLDFEIKQDEIDAVKLQTKLATPARWAVSSGIGDGLASGVHYCGSLIANWSQAAGNTLKGLMTTNYVVTLVTFLYTTRLANKKLKTDIQDIKQRGEDVTLLIEENKLLRNAVAILKNKIKYHEDAVEALRIPLAESEDVVTVHVQPNLQTQLENKVERSQSEFVIEIHEAPEEKKKSCCKRSYETVKSYLEKPYQYTVNVITGASFASGVYYCGDVVVTLISSLNPGATVINAARGINYTLTAINFLATTKFANAEMNLSIHRKNGLQRAVLSVQAEHKKLSQEINELEKALLDQQVMLRRINTHQQVQGRHDDETLPMLDDWKGPLPYGRAAEGRSTLRLFDVRQFEQQRDEKAGREIELRPVRLKMLRSDSIDYVRVGPTTPSSPGTPITVSEPTTPKEDKEREEPKSPLQSQSYWAPRTTQLLTPALRAHELRTSLLGDHKRKV